MGGGRMDMMKIGLGLVPKIEPILKEANEIKGNQIHGKSELISSKEKHFAIYREVFESEHDSEHFVKFVNLLYTIKKGYLPPINTLVILFKALLPLMQPKELKGNQTHGKPEIRKLENGNFQVILKEVFTEKDDAENHLDDAKTIQSMKL